MPVEALPFGNPIGAVIDCATDRSANIPVHTIFAPASVCTGASPDIEANRPLPRNLAHFPPAGYHNPSTNAPRAHGGFTLKRWLFWLTALATLVADLETKRLASRAFADPSGADDVWLLSGAVRLTYWLNTGAAFGVGKGNPWLFLVAVGVLVPIIVWLAGGSGEGLTPRWSLGIVTGGALGNAYDRVAYGGVRDFVELVNPRTGEALWPVFNVADVAIVVGVGVFLVWSLAQPSRPAGDTPDA